MSNSPDLIEKEWIDESQDIYRETLLEWEHTTFKIKKEIIYRDPVTSPSWGAIKDIIITVIEIIL